MSDAPKPTQPKTPREACQPKKGSTWLRDAAALIRELVPLLRLLKELF